MNIRERLSVIQQIINDGVNTQGATRIMELMGASTFPMEIMDEIRLYGEYLPKAQELGFSREQRYLHFLWDSLDKLPISVVVDFSIPFRRMIAKRLFKKCGKNFTAEVNVHFNLGQNLEVGDDVFLNHGVFLDAKGGIVLGNCVGLGEGVEIYTHGHSESQHAQRSYAKVVIGDFAKLYAHAMILPGVTVGEQAIVAAKSMVNRDVEPNMMVAGTPARVVRERNTGGRVKEGLAHIWLHNAAFQDE
jgi:acetyltransferase-like isoleucine patch superfamily enzyme